MDTRETLKQFIETKLLAGTAASVGYDDDLLLSGLLNSLAIVRLVTFMQEHFGLDIPAEDVVIEHFQSIDAVATYVQTRKSQVMAK